VSATTDVPATRSTSPRWAPVVAVCALVWAFVMGQALAQFSYPIRLGFAVAVVAVVLWVGLTSRWVRD
jgi:hypothetical protein